MKKRKDGSVATVEEIAARLAPEMELELVEVTLVKESRGQCLTVYLDKEGGLTLDDCERFHKRLQPEIESVDYDFLEVSSPGVDRPIKTQRDFEKNQGALVEIRLFAPVDGVKAAQGTLLAMDGDRVTLGGADGAERSFPRKAVAIIKPIIVFEDDEEN